MVCEARIISKPKFGRLIARGNCRAVYDAGKYVVKVLHANVKGHNWREVRVWNEREDLRPWLVPIIGITDDGKCLLTMKGKSVKRSQVPTTYPECLHDTGASNWVRIKGKVLFADYGNARMYRRVFGEEYNLEDCKRSIRQ